MEWLLGEEKARIEGSDLRVVKRSRLPSRSKSFSFGCHLDAETQGCAKMKVKLCTQTLGKRTASFLQIVSKVPFGVVVEIRGPSPEVHKHRVSTTSLSKDVPAFLAGPIRLANHAPASPDTLKVSMKDGLLVTASQFQEGKPAKWDYGNSPDNVEINDLIVAQFYVPRAIQTSQVLWKKIIVIGKFWLENI